MALNKSWHKACLRCEGCQKTLARADVQDHEGKPFCKTCYAKKFSTPGYGYGVGAGVSVPLSSNQQEPVRTEKSTYPYLSIYTVGQNDSLAEIGILVADIYLEV